MCFHPFLLALEGVCQDEANIYMLLELARGGELFARLHESGKGPFSEDDTRRARAAG